MKAQQSANAIQQIIKIEKKNVQNSWNHLN